MIDNGDVAAAAATAAADNDDDDDDDVGDDDVDTVRLTGNRCVVRAVAEFTWPQWYIMKTECL